MLEVFIFRELQDGSRGRCELVYLSRCGDEEESGWTSSMSRQFGSLAGMAWRLRTWKSTARPWKRVAERRNDLIPNKPHSMQINMECLLIGT